MIMPMTRPHQPLGKPFRAPSPAEWRSAGLPLIGITPDVIDRNSRVTTMVTLAYAEAVAASGGIPVVLQPIPDLIPEYLRRLGGLVLTGGDDPRMEPFGAPTHPRATPLHPVRQSFESALIESVRTQRPDLPVLGVCLGMQMLALHAGGRMDQHMPDSRPDAARHWDADHSILPVDHAPAHVALPEGVVHSKHRQAIVEPGTLSVIARSDDGVIEAVADPSHPFHIGVQWHPERTTHAPLGVDLFRRLVAAARA